MPEPADKDLSDLFEQVESVLSNHLDPFVVQCETLATQLPKRID